jgi:putative membrane protein
MLRTRLEWLLLYAKGIAMGAADVVPGVSGGTIAFISGIYEELIHSLRSLDHRALMVLLRQGPLAAWKAINGNFLTVLVSGILTSIVLLSRVVMYLLEHYPLPLWSCLFCFLFM